MKQLLKPLFIILLLSSGITTMAQEEIGAPFNPDANQDSLINLPDMLQILPLFGQQFLPSDDDLDSENEIQALYLSNDTLFLIPNGGYILLQDIGVGLNLDSIINANSMQYQFACTEMGSHYLGNPGSGLDPDYELEDDYAYRISNFSSSVFDPNVTVPVNWRKFTVSSSLISAESRLMLVFEERQSALDDDSYVEDYHIFTSPIIGPSEISFYLCGVGTSNSPWISGSLGPSDGVYQENMYRVGTPNNGLRRLFKIYINNGFGWFDTDIRFTWTPF